jgi:hypothetical protein
VGAPDPIGTTVLLNSGVRATVLERIERAGGVVYLVRVVDEDARMPTMLSIPAAELPDMQVVDVKESTARTSGL